MEKIKAYLIHQPKSLETVKVPPSIDAKQYEPCFRGRRIFPNVFLLKNADFDIGEKYNWIIGVYDEVEYQLCGVFPFRYDTSDSVECCVDYWFIK